MIRCSHCRTPNSEEHAACARCGKELPPAPPPLPSLLWELAGRDSMKLLAAAALILIFRVLYQPLLVMRSGMDGQHLMYHLIFGMLLAASYSWQKKQRRASLVLWGLAGGLLSFGLDVLVTWQWLGYKGIWTVTDFFSDGSDNFAARFSYSVLQGVRLAGCAGLLWFMTLRLHRRPKAGFLGLAAVVLGVMLHSQVKGADFSLQNPGWGSFLAYFAAIFAVLWGLSFRELDENSARGDLT